MGWKGLKMQWCQTSQVYGKHQSDYSGRPKASVSQGNEIALRRANLETVWAARHGAKQLCHLVRHSSCKQAQVSSPWRKRLGLLQWHSHRYAQNLASIWVQKLRSIVLMVLGVSFRLSACELHRSGFGGRVLHSNHLSYRGGRGLIGKYSGLRFWVLRRFGSWCNRALYR